MLQTNTLCRTKTSCRFYTRGYFPSYTKGKTMAGRRAAAFQNAEPAEDAATGVPPGAAKAEFGRRLSSLMVERGWNQSEFARQAQKLAPPGISITRDKISKYVRGQVFPNPSHLKVLADALECTPRELLPNRGVPEAGDALPRLAMREIGDGKVWLSVNQAIEFETALQILSLLRGKG